MTERIRTTISLSPEAHDVFKRMAEAGNLSTSRCMGDWLADTMEAAEMLTLRMEEAKREPMRVIKELRAMVAGMALTVDDVESEVRASRRMLGAQRRAAGAMPGPPPPSNTGVLVPSLPPKSRSKRARKGTPT